MIDLDLTLDQALSRLGTPIDGFQTKIQPDDPDFTALFELMNQETISSKCSIYSAIKVILGKDFFAFMNRSIKDFFSYDIVGPSFPDPLNVSVSTPWEVILNAVQHASGPVGVNIVTSRKGALLALVQSNCGFDPSAPVQVGNGHGKGMRIMKKDPHWVVSWERKDSEFATYLLHLSEFVNF